MPGVCQWCGVPDTGGTGYGRGEPHSDTACAWRATTGAANGDGCAAAVAPPAGTSTPLCTGACHGCRMPGCTCVPAAMGLPCVCGRMLGCARGSLGHNACRGETDGCPATGRGDASLPWLRRATSGVKAERSVVSDLSSSCVSASSCAGERALGVMPCPRPLAGSSIGDNRYPKPPQGKLLSTCKPVFQPMHSIRAESVVQEAECAVYWTAAVDGGWHIKLQIVSDDSMTRGVTTQHTQRNAIVWASLSVMSAMADSTVPQPATQAPGSDATGSTNDPSSEYVVA